MGPFRAAIPLALLGVYSVVIVDEGYAQQGENFYADQTITFIVGFGPGGGYDFYTRLLAQHMGRHIPGSPGLVVQNMAGAGSVRAANYVYNNAPQDGTYIAAVNQNMPMYRMLGGANAEFDPVEMQWLGSMAHSNSLVYTWHDSGIETIEDARANEVVVGGAGTTSDSHIFPTILNSLIGTRFEVIHGYEGTGEIDFALERGEVMGRGGNSWASLRANSSHWLNDNLINLLIQVGVEPEPDLPDVPMLMEMVETEEQRQIVAVVALPTAIGYAHWLAPGVPAERVDILRDAYAATMTDPDFLAEAERLGIVIRPQSGEAIQALVEQAATTPQDVLDRTADILGWSSR